MCNGILFFCLDLPVVWIVYPIIGIMFFLFLRMLAVSSAKLAIENKDTYKEAYFKSEARQFWFMAYLFLILGLIFGAWFLAVLMLGGGMYSLATGNKK